MPRSVPWLMLPAAEGRQGRAAGTYLHTWSGPAGPVEVAQHSQPFLTAPLLLLQALGASEKPCRSDRASPRGPMRARRGKQLTGFPLQ